MKVQVLVGMIASGKSTFAAAEAKHGAVCINDDTVVNLIHGGNYTLYDKELKVLYKTVENTILGMAITLNRNVIVDRGLNVSKSGRRRWVALAKSFDVQCEAVVFDRHPSRVHAERRVQHDGRGYGIDYWTRVAQHHESEWEDPVLSEGFDAITYWTWDKESGRCPLS